MLNADVMTEHLCVFFILMQLAAALQKAPEMSLPAPLPTSSLPEGEKNSVHLIKFMKGIFAFFPQGRKPN